MVRSTTNDNKENWLVFFSYLNFTAEFRLLSLYPIYLFYGFSSLGVAVAVLNRFLYAIGGFDGENRLRSAECYCPDTKRWSLVAPMNTPRSGAGSASLNG